MTRRNLITAAGVAAASTLLPENSRIVAAVPKAGTEFGRVKITDVKTASVKLTYYSAHVVKVTTDFYKNGYLEMPNKP